MREALSLILIFHSSKKDFLVQKKKNKKHKSKQKQSFFKPKDASKNAELVLTN